MRSVAVLQSSNEDVRKVAPVAAAPVAAAAGGAVARGGFMNALRGLFGGGGTTAAAKTAPKASAASTSMVPTVEAPAGQKTLGNIMGPSTSAPTPTAPAPPPKPPTTQTAFSSSTTAPDIEQQVNMQKIRDDAQTTQQAQRRKDLAQNVFLGANIVQGHRAKSAAEQQQEQQSTMEAAQRGREISTGTTTAKSEYFGDWVLDEPMLKAWDVLKARMEIGPHEERQDDLIQHLKNLSGQHSIRTNDDDNSFILDNVHDDDEDITRKLIQSFGRKFADGEPVTEKKPTKAPRYF